jgi:plasmid maintenance system antidote protein VapI
MAIKLSRYLGTSEELWLNLQNQYDLYMVKQKRQKFLKHIRHYRELHGEAV